MTRTFCDRCGIELIDTPFQVTSEVGTRVMKVRQFCLACHNAWQEWCRSPTTATANAHHDPRFSSMDCACVACESWRHRNLPK